MGLEVLQIGGWLDGDLRLKDAPTDYVAGMAAKITSTGADVATAPGDVIGVFKNDKRDDMAGGPEVGDAPVTGDLDTTIVMGSNKVKMTPGVLPSGTVAAPFVWPGTAGGGWAVGDKMYVTTGGKWDNAPAAGGEPHFGHVIEAPASATGTLVALLGAANGD